MVLYYITSFVLSCVLSTHNKRIGAYCVLCVRFQWPSHVEVLVKCSTDPVAMLLHILAWRGVIIRLRAMFISCEHTGKMASMIPGAGVVAPVTETHKWYAHAYSRVYTYFTGYFLNSMHRVDYIAHIILHDKLDGFIEWDAHNTAFGSKSSSISSTWFQGPTRVSNTNGVSVALAFFCRAHRVIDR